MYSALLPGFGPSGPWLVGRTLLLGRLVPPLPLPADSPCAEDMVAKSQAKVLVMQVEAGATTVKLVLWRTLVHGVGLINSVVPVDA